MPTLRVALNFPIPAATALDSAKHLSQQVAVALGKPEAYVAVEIVPDRCIVFGGSDMPCALCDVEPIGAIDQQHNEAVSAALADFLSATFGVPPERYYCRFVDYDAGNWGHQRATFATL